MTRLIESLKAEHLVIAQTLNKVKAAGINTKEGQVILLSAKKGLLAHLKKEDRELYPLLNKAAESDQNLKRTLALFANDMNDISFRALAFFDKYSANASGIEFARDFGGLFATLSQRIRKEENIIYKKFDEIN